VSSGSWRRENNVVRHSGPDGGILKVLDGVELVAERLKWIIFIFERHGGPLAGYRIMVGSHWDQKWEM